MVASDPALACRLTEPGGPGSGVVAVAGYFNLIALSPATLRIVHHHQFGIAAVEGCFPSPTVDIVQGG